MSNEGVSGLDRELVRARLRARLFGADVPALVAGRFQLLERLGGGGMGVVYAAHDQALDRRVALKTLRCADPAAIYRFKAEFRSLVDVAHPNLVTLHELTMAAGEWFFTMELVKGSNFLSWVRRPAPRLRIALLQLAEGLSALHAAGKLHRDIKPSNVLVNGEGRVVVLDFGLVTELVPRERQPWDLQFAGTPHYMAPEVLGGEAASPASDWYSVGVMLYEALTGCVAFRDGDPL